MTRDAISLSIYRRKARFYVSAGVLTPGGFQCLTMLAVEGRAAGLLDALERSERIALELTKAMPREKRVTAKTPEPDWSVAGVSTFEELTEDSTFIHVVRDDELTELEYWVPTNDGGFVRTILQEELGAKTPMKKVAAAVTEMFARADREKPRPETAKDLK